MKRLFFYLFVFGLIGFCIKTSAWAGSLDPEIRQKVRVVAFLPFEIASENKLAGENRHLLEDNFTLWIMHSDSGRSFVFPGGIRLQFKDSNAGDKHILKVPPDSLGKLFSAEALLYTKVIRLYESEGSNQTTRQIRASKYVRRGVELLVEFRLVEVASGKLLWKNKIRRFGADVPEAVKQVSQAAAEAWPLKK